MFLTRVFFVKLLYTFDQLQSCDDFHLLVGSFVLSQEMAIPFPSNSFVYKMTKIETDDTDVMRPPQRCQSLGDGPRPVSTRVSGTGWKNTGAKPLSHLLRHHQGIQSRCKQRAGRTPEQYTGQTAMDGWTKKETGNYLHKNLFFGR